MGDADLSKRLPIKSNDELADAARSHSMISGSIDDNRE